MSTSSDAAAEGVIYYIQKLEQILATITDADKAVICSITSGTSNHITHDLPNELQRLKAMISEFSTTKKALVTDIRSLLLDAQELVELSIFLAYSTKKARDSSVRYLTTVRKALDLEEMISMFQAKLRNIDQYMGKVNLDPGANPNQEIRTAADTTAFRRGKAPLEKDTVIGYEDAAKEVIKLLTGESEHLEVISLVGVPGLGKTTLAKDVLNDPKIKSQFPTRVFVHVSEEYQRKELFLKILGSFAQLPEKVNEMSEEELAAYLRKQLETRKYLIVMDDVRKKQDWDQLKVAFSNNKRSSRVLITTRKNYIAAYANPSSKPHYLHFLKLNESRELLRKKVFGEKNCPEELQGYELAIATKCEGLPLAIVSIANILLKDPVNKYWWETVVKSFNDYIPSYNSKDLIIQSYKHLPYHLKLCFLYLRMLPRDFEIPVWKLVRLWIAEGFIPPEGDLELEDKAEKYLEELVGRNLVFVGKRRSNGRIKTCRIYEPLRHFCKEEATEEKIFQEIEIANQRLTLHDDDVDEHRRICINSHLLDYISARPSGKHIHSFLTFTSEETTLTPEHAYNILNFYEVLRVLDVKSLIFTRFPLKPYQLIFLKYLAMSSMFKILPAAMSELENLQTIIIGTTSGTLVIEFDIWKMRQLRHLHVNASVYLPRKNKAETTDANLQTLSFISPESCGKDVLEKTPKLRKLGIWGRIARLFGLNNEFDTLSKLEHLENLKLLNDDIDFPLQRLPPESSFPRKLTKLTLLNTLLTWNEMSKLGKLENLEVLKLKDNAFMGKVWQTEVGGFQRLMVLHIGATDLMVWQASADHFPVLRCLVLRQCDKLQVLPLGLGDIPSFQRIDLYDTNPSVVSSAGEIQRLKQRSGTRSNGIHLSVYPPDH